MELWQAKWVLRAWRMVDQFLADTFKKLRRTVRALRIGRALIILLLLAMLAAAGMIVVFPEWTNYVVVGVLVMLAIPWFVVYALLGIPLRQKSVVRLIRMGYPKNVRELGIRVVAQKLHEESIESEELLVEAAWNESKKVLAKYRERAEKLKRQLDAMDE